MKKQLCALLLAGCLLVLAGCGGGASGSASSESSGEEFTVDRDAAGDFPIRPITVINPWSDYGKTGRLFRSLCKTAESYLLQSVGVKSIPGDNGDDGFSAIISAQPDGYTLGVITTELNLLKPRGIAHYSYEDLDPLLRISVDASAVVVPADSPYTSLDQLLDTARTIPQSVDMGNAGFGTLSHLSAALVERECGVEFYHIPYNSVHAVVEAMAGGYLEAACITVDEAETGLEEGTLRLLAIMSDGPYPDHPNVSTFQELGFAVEFGRWQGLALPKGVPEAERKLLHDLFRAALHDPEFLLMVEERGMRVAYQDSAAFTSFIEANYKLVEEMLLQTGLV